MLNRILRFMLATGIVLSVLSALPVQSAMAGGGGVNRYVSTTGANSGDCTNSAAPCLTIAYAIAQSGLASTDQINIAAGTYHEYLTIDRSVNLIGVQENLTIIDGGVAAAGMATTALGAIAVFAAGGWLAIGVACTEDPDCPRTEECREIPAPPGGYPYRQCMPRQGP